MTEEQELAEAILKVADWNKFRFDTDIEGRSNEHLQSLLKEIIAGKTTGAKAHRYIGWVQGVLCMKGIMSLNEAKNLNRNVIKAMI
jgi:hypothetical protein